MAIEKGKVQARLLVKYKGKSLTKNFIEKLADKYAAKIETDDDATIDSFIEERDEVIQEAISETDRRVTEAVNKAKKPGEQQQQQQQEPKPEEVELPADTPEWAKGLLKGLEAVNKKVDGFQTERTHQSLAERFQKDERLKGIDPKLLKGRLPKTEEEFEAAVEEAAEDLKDFAKPEGEQSQQQQQSQQRFGRDKPGFVGKNIGNNTKKDLATDKELDSVMGKILPGSVVTEKAT